MTIHKSLKIKSQLLRSRNVWSRLERIQKLEQDGRFAEGRSVFGLPKVRTRFKIKGLKKAAAPKEAAAAAVAGAPAAASAPAAAAAPAAGGAKKKA